MSNYNICIDFGTCNSVISYIEDDTLKQIYDEVSGDVLLPTTIYFISDNIKHNDKLSDFLPDSQYIIGSAANDLVNINKDWENYYYQFKRFLGITSKSGEVYKEFLSKYGFEYTLDEDTIYFFLKVGDYKIKFNIIDLITLYFKALYKIICSKLSLTDKINIILTCPAYFHDLQRSQLKRAAENAGFIVSKLCNEPTTAAVFYIHKFNLSNESKKYIIYDLGGGTIDTTVVDYYADSGICEVIDIDGNNSLGGIDIDNLLVLDIYNRYYIDKTNNKWFNKIKKCAEEIKIKLTFNLNHDIYLENVPILKNNKIIIVDNLKISYSRHLFNNIINNLIDDMIYPIQKMYELHKTNNIIFIGGPTQMPLLKSKVSSILQLVEINNLYESYNSLLYKTIVSQGGSILSKKIETKQNFCLLEIIPMNIGISDPDNNMIIMINKNSKIPISIEKVFSTSYDCQRTINIEIFEGTEINCSLNTFIGSYKIVGIPPLPKGMILIKLLFKISYNGILDISISGFKNSSDDSSKSFDFKLCENIKLIPNILAKELLKKLLLGNTK
jgi:molecular chaperone DnaK (HSP70)